MSDVVRKAQDASARIARRVTEGHVTSSRDDQSQSGTRQNPVAIGLGADDPDHDHDEDVWPDY